MSGMDRTTIYREEMPLSKQSGKLAVSVFDSDGGPQTIELDGSREELQFGRSDANNLVLKSNVVSSVHGRFIRRDSHWYIEDRAVYGERPSTNGLKVNGVPVYSRQLHDGDLIRIDNGAAGSRQGVLFIVSGQSAANCWQATELTGKHEIMIGRAADCDIVLPHISVSKHHASVLYERGSFYMTDNASTNGVLVNGRRIHGRHPLSERDVISITNTRLIFAASHLYYYCSRSGISVDAVNVSVIRGTGDKAQVTLNKVSVSVGPGELVSIIGGSGAGKSTLLSCMCGYLTPTDGNVLINGADLYSNFDELKAMIGYVPQEDIVYDNLTVYDMLRYAAKLRLPRDTSGEEYENAIDRAIQMVELGEKKDSLIRSLSGGQRKRASIAVELISDPSLLFLDEPTSGLDPGTERNLMRSLRNMASGGKTVILVTHSTLQLGMCDKIAFMGGGGNLCFYGSCSQALRFFNVPDIVDTYSLITDDTAHWRRRYDRIAAAPNYGGKSTGIAPMKKRGKYQLETLCSRYARLIVNDRQRLLLMLLQAPFLALLIALVADGEQFRQYEMTNSLLFALACSAFWIGILNAIQEICKERVIVRREYMSGLSLTAYLMSKFLVLSVMCLVQSLMLVTVFSLCVGLPDQGLIVTPWLEMLITTFLGAVAATAMGLFVSALFKNPDRAMTLAPILLMPQILFSGLIFKLEGVTEAVSWFAVCRWTMEGYGSCANLNALDLKLQQENIPVPHTFEAFYEYTAGHLLQSWGILLLFTVLCLVIARAVLPNLKKK